MDDRVEHLAKRPRLNSKSGDNSSLPPLSGGSLQFVDVDLTSDALDTKAELQASQLEHQPRKVWYGKVDPGSRQMKLTKGNDTECSLSEKKENLDPDEADEADSGFTKLVPTGKGTMAAILDSGINTGHMAFQGMSDKICPYSKSFVDGDITDKIGHGTHCAGLFCGNPTELPIPNTNSVMPFVGSAPDAKVMVCKVVQDGSSIANTGAVCEAIDYIIEYNRAIDSSQNGDRVNVISLSFGATGFSHKLTQRIQDALSSNIIVVCAASNNGRKNRQPITFPARLGHVLCIGSCNESCKPSKFTPVGREVDFLAPGEDLWVPTIEGESCFCAVSGTSFATPSVAGLVCQVLEDLSDVAARTGEDQLVPLMSNVWCMRELLKSMATNQGSHNDEVGYGVLEPLEYFEKTDQEKLRLIKKILHQ